MHLYVYSVLLLPVCRIYKCSIHIQNMFEWLMIKLENWQMQYINKNTCETKHNKKISNSSSIFVLGFELDCIHFVFFLRFMHLIYGNSSLETMISFSSILLGYWIYNSFWLKCDIANDVQTFLSHIFMFCEECHAKAHSHINNNSKKLLPFDIDYNKWSENYIYLFESE